MEKGNVLSFRRSISNIDFNQIIVGLDNCKDKKMAGRLVGKKVRVKTGKEIVRIGKVMSPHGSNGSLRVRFEKNLPMKVVGQKVVVY